MIEQPSTGCGTSTHSNNLTALNVLMAEWSNANDAYATRVAKLRDVGVLGGTVKLNSNSVQNDSNAADTLLGSLASPNNTDLDWFFLATGDVGDILNGLIPGEVVTQL